MTAVYVVQWSRGGERVHSTTRFSLAAAVEYAEARRANGGTASVYRIVRGIRHKVEV